MSKVHRLVVLSVVTLISILTVSGYHAQEPIKNARVLRPPLVALSDPCVLVAQPGSYLVPKGSLIEIDWAPTGTSGCAGLGVVCSTSLNGVLERVKRLGTWGIAQDSYATNAGSAWFVRAKMVGNDTITVTINGISYVYEIEVY